MRTKSRSSELAHDKIKEEHLRPQNEENELLTDGLIIRLSDPADCYADVRRRCTLQKNNNDNNDQRNKLEKFRLFSK